MNLKFSAGNTQKGERVGQKDCRKYIMTPKEGVLIFYRNQTIHIWEAGELRSMQAECLCVGQHSLCFV